MRTKNILKHLILGALMVTTGKVVGQSTTPGNVAAGPNDFLGWRSDAVDSFPLRVGHEGAVPRHFWTSATLRGLTNERVMYPGLHPCPSMPAEGFTLITPDTALL